LFSIKVSERRGLGAITLRRCRCGDGGVAPVAPVVVVVEAVGYCPVQWCHYAGGGVKIHVRLASGGEGVRKQTWTEDSSGSYTVQTEEMIVSLKPRTS